MSVSIAPGGVDILPETTFPDYEAFTGMPGESMKEEIRTTIRRVTLLGGDGAEQGILKVYRYPGLTGLRTWRQLDKASRELNGLALSGACGFPVVEGLASGVRRSALGFVSECFILTRLEPNLTALRDWLESVREDPDTARDIESALTDLGRYMKACHENRLFILAPNAKNVHVRLVSGKFAGLVLLDVPYARHIHSQAGAQWAQGRDLGALHGSIVKRIEEQNFEAFFTGYGDDPLGDSIDNVRNRMMRGADVYMRKTPLSRMLRGLRRSIFGNKR